MNDVLIQSVFLTPQERLAEISMTSDDIAAVMDEHLTLTAYGFGTLDYPPQTRAEKACRFSESRARLLGSADECSRVCQWLAPVVRTKTINERHSSYGLKHWVERQCGHYCSNGAFIAAAIFMGFRFVQDGPYACFNMSEQSLSLLSARPSWKSGGGAATSLVS